MRMFYIKSRFCLLFLMSILILLPTVNLKADAAVGLSNFFSLDTRENLPPDGPWQILTNKGDSYNEDLLIDNDGKVWAFYLRSKGSGQPVYMKILQADGYIYKTETPIGTATTLQSNDYQTVRACLNPKTGDVWVAIQGNDGTVGKGYFIVLDGKGNERYAQKFLPGEGGVYYPKMACDKNGKMWFIWQTDSTYSGSSSPEYACYSQAGELIHGPAKVINAGNTSYTDIVVDGNNRIWFIYERGQVALFSSILNNDETYTEYQPETLRKSFATQYGFYPQRIAFADTVADRVWILGRDPDVSEQEILICNPDGDLVGTVPSVGNANFSVNEFNRLEIIRHGYQNYEKGEFNASTGERISNPRWSTIFDTVHSFVKNGVTFNRTYELLKAYLVQTDESVTKFYLQQLTKAPNIYVAPKSIDFDSVRLNTSKTVPVLVENAGTALLTVTNISSVESQFFAEPTSFNLEPEQRQRVDISFSPNVLQEVEANVIFNSNDPDQPEFSLPVTGFGRDMLDQKIAIAPDTLNFEKVPTTSSKTLTLYVSNTGEKPLNVTELVILSPRFTTETDTLEIKPDVTRKIAVTFQPTDTDSIFSRLELHNDDPTSWRKDVYLIGVGREPFTQKIAVEPDTLNFGDVAKDEQLTRSIIISNTGEQQLNITDVQVNDTTFIPQEREFSIAGGNNHELSVTFHPRAIASYEAALTISSNDTSNRTVTVLLEGVGHKVNKPQIMVSTDSLYFGAVQQGQRRSKWFKVWNAGDLIVDVTEIAVNGSQFSVSENSFSLESDAEKWIEVTYQPDNLQTHAGLLEIRSNDPQNPEVTIKVRGNGAENSPPQITINPQEIDFDTTAVNQPATAWLVVSNQGQQTLSIDEVTVNHSHFKVEQNAFSLNSGQVKYLPVYFQPTETGLVAGKLTLTSNDPVDGNLEIPLTGVGRAAKSQQIYVSPERIDFPVIAEGDSVYRNLLVKNIGEIDLKVKRVSAKEPQFSCSVVDVTLTPNETSHFPVLFKPGSVISVTSEIIIENDAPKDSLKTVVVSGEGRRLTSQKIYWTPESIVFETTVLGGQSQENVWIYNQGEQVLNISKIQITDPQFSTSLSGFSLAPGKFRALPIFYSPSQNVSASGILTISCNDATNSTVDIRLNGRARELYEPNLATGAEQLNFGSIPLGKVHSQNLYIRNTGEKNLVVSNIQTQDNQFSVSSTAFTVLPNSEQLVMVTFRPAKLDTVVSQLEIISNSSESDTTRVLLAGKGRMPLPQQIQVSVDTLDFGAVPQDQVKTLNLYVQNIGEYLLNINKISPTTNYFTIQDTAFSLQPGQLRIVPVQFEPTRITDYVAVLTILSDDLERPEIQVALVGSGRNLIPATIVVQPDSLDFQSLGVGLWTTRSLRISNNGELSLRIREIAVNNENFSVDVTNLDVPADSSKDIEVVFAPSAFETYNAELSFETNDPENANVTVALTGTGREKTGQQISIQQDTLKFQGIGIGQVKESYFIISNLGETALLVQNIGIDNQQFTIDSTSFPLEAVTSRQVTVTFRPVHVGADSGKITIQSNDSNQPQSTIFLQSSSRELISPQISLSTTKLGFDSIGVGQSQTKMLYFSNSGDYPLEISGIVSSDSQFTVSADTGFTVESGQTYPLQVVFTPGKIGKSEAGLIIYSNDPENPGNQVTLSGTGIAISDQRIAVDPKQIEFGTIPVSDSSRQKFWVINLGEKTLTVDSVGVSDRHFIVDQSFFNIKPAASQESWVTFKPTNFDTINAQVRLKSNDPVNPYLEVPLSGSGRNLKPQQLALSPAEEIDFKEVGWGRSSIKPVYVNNIGEMPLTVNNITSSDTNLFRVNATNFTVAAGRTQIVYVDFTPQLTGTDSSKKAFSKTLTVSSDDSEQTILLKGVGRPLAGPVIDINVTQLEFETTAVGRTKTKTLVIGNKGEIDLEVSNIAIKAADKKSQFRFDKITLIIAPDSTKTVKIIYAPTQLDSFKTDLEIYSNDTTTSNFAIPLTAKSVNYSGPTIVLNPEEIDFGSLLRGSKRAESIYIRNDGTELLHVTRIQSMDQTHFSANLTSLNVSPGESSKVAITFSPSAEGSYASSLLFVSDDKYRANVTVNVTGKGVRDSSGTNVLKTMEWGEMDTPLTAGSMGSQASAWFIRDFENYEIPVSANLSLAYHQGVEVYVNGSLVDSSSNDETFQYWTKEISVLDYLVYGRNRIAIRLLATNDQSAFDAELVLNSSVIILRGLNNAGNPNISWWRYQGKTSPVQMNGSGRSWYSAEYGWDGLSTVVGQWDFAEGAGDTLFDTSVYGRRAILNGTSWVDGLNGKVLSFNGSSSFARLEASLNTIPLTIQMWLRSTGTATSNQVILSNATNSGNGHGLYLTPGGKLGIYYFNDKFATDYTIVQNAWNYISVRYLADSIYVYVNSNLAGRSRITSQAPSGYSYCHLGNTPGTITDTKAFQGEISGLQIYNTSAVPNQIPTVVTARLLAAPKATAGAQVKITFDLEPSITQIRSGSLKYRLGGATSVSEVAMTVVNDTLTALLPADAVNIRGLAYRASMNTDFGSVYYPSQTDTSQMDWLIVRTRQEVSTFSTRSEKFQMISVPYELGSKSVSAVLDDDFGTYDPYKWRLFQWKSLGNRFGYYIENEDTSWSVSTQNFSRGQAFWLVVDEPNKTFNADSGYSAESDDPFALTLQQGWNQIGCPFPFSVNWDSVAKNDNISGLYFRNPVTNNYDVNQPLMIPWYGYFVNNQLPYSVTVNIPAKEAASVRPKPVLAERFLMNYENAIFALTIAGKCGTLNDHDNLLAVTEGAANEWDPADALEAPPIGNYISLWIDNSDWKDHAGAYCIDVRAANERGYVWRLTAEGLVTRQDNKMELNFENHVPFPESEKVFLFDLEDEVAIDLKAAAAYHFEVEPGKKFNRTFKVVFGDEAFIRDQSDGIPLVPLAFELLQNFPNPFNPATMIHFSIPKKAHTRLAIYNILGQEVKVMVDEVLRSARHHVVWDGKDYQGLPVASGVYFIRLRSPEKLQIRKMMLIR